MFSEEQPQTERGRGGREGGRKGGGREGGREGVANWSSHQSEAGNANASGTSVVRLNTEEESRSSFKLFRSPASFEKDG